MTKIYSVVNREEAKGLVGKYCLFSDRCMDIEDCIFRGVSFGILKSVTNDELSFLDGYSDVFYRYVAPINEDVLIEIEEGLKCYDKQDTFGALYAVLLRLQGGSK